MLAGLCLAAESEMLLILLVPFLAGLALTTAQLTSGNPQLALLFPWRVSVLLVPTGSDLLGTLLFELMSYADPAAASVLAGGFVLVVLLVLGLNALRAPRAQSRGA